MKVITVIKLFAHYSGIEFLNPIIAVKLVSCMVSYKVDAYLNTYNEAIKDPALYRLIANRKLKSFRVSFDSADNMAITIYVSLEEFTKKGDAANDRARQEADKCVSGS